MYWKGLICLCGILDEQVWPDRLYNFFSSPPRVLIFCFHVSITYACNMFPSPWSPYLSGYVRQPGCVSREARLYPPLLRAPVLAIPLAFPTKHALSDYWLAIGCNFCFPPQFLDLPSETLLLFLFVGPRVAVGLPWRTMV